MISNKIILLTESDIEKHFYYQSHDGIFFFLTKKNRISVKYECRVELANYFNKHHTRIGFQYKNLNIKKLNQFFEKREEKLNIPPEKRSVFYRVSPREDEDREIILNENKKGETDEIKSEIVVMEPAKIWPDNQTSRGILTLLLRGAVLYYKNQLKEVYEGYDLIRYCVPAINHFLKGNTKPTYESLKFRGEKYNLGKYDYHEDRFGGFVQFFSDRSQEELNNLLVKV